MTQATILAMIRLNYLLFIVSLLSTVCPGFPFLDEEKTPTFLSANVGDSVVFNCPLEFPHDIVIPYILHWRKEKKNIFSWYGNWEGNTEVSEAYNNRISLLPPESKYGKGSINLTRIKDTDEGWYECRVNFPNRSPSSRLNGTWFYLTVIRPDLMGIQPNNQTVMEGENAHFQCTTKDKETGIIWYKDGIPITELPDLYSRISISDQGSLTITNTNMDDAGQYRCKISSKNLLQSTFAVLDVHHKAKAIAQPSELFLTYGQPAILECQYRSNPPLTKLRWEKDGFLFDPYNIAGVFISKNHTLYFNKVDETHAGEYICIPYNELGTEGPSAPINVIVQRPPEFIITPNDQYLRKKGESIEIPCDALDNNGKHRPKIYWMKKDGSALPSGRSFVIGGNLTIANIEENDRGVYQCVASNEVTNVTRDTHLIIENSFTRAPRNLTANSTTTSITLKWIPGYSKVPLEYNVWFRKLEMAEWRTIRVGKGANQVTLNNLQPGQEYELMVLCQDQKGDGMFSKALRYKTKGVLIKENQDLKTQTLETFQQIGPPRNLRSNLDLEGFKISWDPPEFGSESLRVYTLSWYEGEHLNDITKADTIQTYFIVRDLEENKSYHFQVTAVNSDDYESTSERFTLYIPDYYRSRMINVGITLGLLVTLAALIGIWYIRNVYRSSLK